MGKTYTGVVDEQVETGLLGVKGLCGGLARLEVLEVEVEEAQVELLVDFAAHLLDGLIDAGLGAAGDVDAGILEGELLGRLVADAVVSCVS